MSQTPASPNGAFASSSLLPLSPLMSLDGGGRQSGSLIDFEPLTTTVTPTAAPTASASAPAPAPVVVAAPAPVPASVAVMAAAPVTRLAAPRIIATAPTTTTASTTTAAAAPTVSAAGAAAAPKPVSRLMAPKKILMSPPPMPVARAPAVTTAVAAITASIVSVPVPVASAAPAVATTAAPSVKLLVEKFTQPQSASAAASAPAPAVKKFDMKVGKDEKENVTPRNAPAPESGDASAFDDGDDADMPTVPSDSDEKNVRVYVRVRPPSGKEMDAGYRACIKPITPQSGAGSDSVSNVLTLLSTPNEKTFQFDHVAGPESTQEEVFLRVGKPISDQCLAGYNGTIFAYGQTGSGKTFTIQGAQYTASTSAMSSADAKSDNTMRGLMPRVFQYLCGQTARQQRKSNGRIKFVLQVSLLEIYNDQIFDLLNPNNKEPLNLREDNKRGVYVEGLKEETVTTADECLRVTEAGIQNRRVGETAMNRESSRSHCVFGFTITSTETTPETGVSKERYSRFNMIDLAGSERQKSTAAAGGRLKEASRINKSLSALGNVILALSEIARGKQRHVHYRDSKLTFLLKDSLGGNSLTYIVACVSPAGDSFNETLSTLQFAQRAKFVKNDAKINEDESGSLLVIKAENARLMSRIKEFEAAAASAELSATVAAQIAAERDAANTQIAAVESRCLNLQKQIDTVSQQLSELSAVRDSWKLKADRTETVVDALTMKCADHVSQYTTLTAKLAAAQSEWNEKEANSNAAHKAAADELAATQSRLAAEEQKSAALTADGNEQRAALESLRAQLSAASIRESELTVELKQMTELESRTRQELAEQIAARTKSDAEVSSLTAAMANRARELTETGVERDGWKSKHDTAAATIDSLNTKLSEQQTEFQSLNDRFTNLQSESTEKEHAFNHAKRVASDELAASQDRVTAEEAKAAALTQRVREQIVAIDTLNSQVEDVSAANLDVARQLSATVQWLHDETEARQTEQQTATAQQSELSNRLAESVQKCAELRSTAEAVATDRAREELDWENELAEVSAERDRGMAAANELAAKVALHVSEYQVLNAQFTAFQTEANEKHNSFAAAAAAARNEFAAKQQEWTAAQTAAHTQLTETQTQLAEEKQKSETLTVAVTNANREVSEFAAKCSAAGERESKLTGQLEATNELQLSTRKELDEQTARRAKAEDESNSLRTELEETVQAADARSHALQTKFDQLTEMHTTSTAEFEQKLSTVTAARDATAAAAHELTAKYSEQSAELQAAKTQFAAFRTESAEAESTARRMQQSTNDELSSVRTRLAAASANGERVSTEFDAARALWARQSAELSAARDANATAVSEWTAKYNTRHSECDALNARLTALQTESTAAERAFAQAKKASGEEFAALQTRFNAEAAKSGELSAKVNALSTQLNDEKAALATARNELKALTAREAELNSLLKRGTESEVQLRVKAEAEAAALRKELKENINVRRTARPHTTHFD